MDGAAVRNLLKSGGPANPTEDEQANLNADQAYEFIDFLSDQDDIPIDELVIRQLNRYFIRGASEALTPGAYRKGLNQVGKFTPPDQEDVPGLMRSFALWLRSEDEEIHPVIKAGLAHIHLIAIHPFWDGNGRTARGLATLLLQRSPFRFRKLLSLESHMFNIKDQYFTAIESTLGTRFAADYDATPWLEFFARGLETQAEILIGGLTEWHRMMQDAQGIFAAKGWNQRQADGFAFAVQTGQISRSNYMEINRVSPATASRDLAKLVEAGILTTEGKTRSRIYRPGLLSLEMANRPAQEQLPLMTDA